MNIKIAEQIIKELVSLGIRSFCLCPGGRVAPFVEVLSKSKGLELLFFFEERSACFFALGRAKRDGRPVAILTTSGTAVAELLPGLIEAYYSHIPLVVITADRPLEFGKKGAPQTLKSTVQILQGYCQISKNIEREEDINLSDRNLLKASFHLNVCFDEPLIDKPAELLDFSDRQEPFFLKESGKVRQKEEIPTKLDPFLRAGGINKSFKKEAHFKERAVHSQTEKFFKEEMVQRAKLSKSLKKTVWSLKKEEIVQWVKLTKSALFNLNHIKAIQTYKKPLLLIGELKQKEQKAVQDILSCFKGIVYAEPLSNLQDGLEMLTSGEKILSYALKRKEIDSVIRLGGIPRTRFWRDLEKRDIPVFNFASPPYYPGLSRRCLNWPLGEGLQLLSSYLSSLKEFGGALKEFDKAQTKKWQKILSDHPQSEEFWLWAVQKSLKTGSKVFLGNSSPIRFWDKLEKKKDLYITGQAGVNGIDGLLSRFLGECEPQKNNVGILGDLSLLYDMAGFWGAKDLPPWTLIVINNFGGQFFSRLFKNPAFLNRHKLSFEPLAKIWGLNYELYKHSSDFIFPKKPYSLIEIRPEEQETKACFKKYVSIWDNI